MRNSVTARVRAGSLLTGAALLLAAALPSHAQAPCTTEVSLYVEKSASASTRNAAREVLLLFFPGTLALPGGPTVTFPGPTTVKLFSFAGDVSTSSLAQFTAPSSDATLIDAALQGAVLMAPSSATTDLLALFRHIESNMQPAAAPPLGPVRRFVFILGDFAHAPLSQAWQAEGAALLDRLRQRAAANQNVHLIAIQSPPPGPMPSGVHRDVTSAIARSFLFFEDSTAGLQEIADLLSDRTTPLGMNLSKGPNPNTLLLQVSNPTCNLQQPIVYRARGEAVAPHVLTLTCPSALQPGLGGGPCPVDLNLLRTLAPANRCINLWIEAESGPDSLGMIRRGTAPQSILLGNCVEIAEGIHDLAAKLDRSPELAVFPRSQQIPSSPRGHEQFVTGLRVRGHLDVPQASLIWEEVAPGGAIANVLARQTVRAADFNVDAFHGALRHLLYFIDLPESVARRVCLAGRGDEPARLRMRLNWGTGETTADLVRRYPTSGGLFLHDPWESQLFPLLILLVLAIFVAYFLLPADAGILSKILLILAIGFLALGLAAHYASSLGSFLEKSFALRLKEISTAGVLLIGACYFILFLMGFFDRRPTAKECLDEVLTKRFKARRSRRFWRTLSALVLLSLPILVTLGTIWFLQRSLEECRFTYTAVKEP